MIWGLDLEDTQSNAVCEAQSANSPELDTAIVGSQGSGPPNQVPYDLTRNAHPIYQRFNDNKDIRWDSKRVNICAQPLPEFRPQNIHQARAWDDTPIDIHKLTPCVHSRPGIDPLQYKRKPESTSPAFIPAPPRQWSSPSMTPRIFVEPRPGTQITPGPRLSAIEIAQRYRAERQQAVLPSLQFSSPTWSPSVSLDSPAAPPFSLDSASPQLYHEHELASNFNSSQSINCCRRDLPAEPCVTHRELKNIVNLPGPNYTDPNFSSRMNTLPQNSYARPPSAIDMSLILKRLPPGSGSRSQDSPALLQQPNATRTRLLQGPRIHSIPMTRLIQRRLSSVAEELEDSSPCSHSQSARRDGSSEAPARDTIIIDDLKANIAGDQGHGDIENGNKENTTEKATVKKKWRVRKKAVATVNK